MAPGSTVSPANFQPRRALSLEAIVGFGHGTRPPLPRTQPPRPPPGLRLGPDYGTPGPPTSDTHQPRRLRVERVRHAPAFVQAEVRCWPDSLCRSPAVAKRTNRKNGPPRRRSRGRQQQEGEAVLLGLRRVRVDTGVEDGHSPEHRDREGGQHQQAPERDTEKFVFGIGGPFALVRVAQREDRSVVSDIRLP